MAERLRFLAKEEGLKVDDDVIHAIVRTADGYVRDAESLLDQIASLGDKKVTRDIAELILPVSRLPLAVDLLRVSSARDVGGTLSLLRTYVDDGVPAMTLFDDLLSVVRSLIRAEDPNERKLLSGGPVAGLLHTFNRSELGDIALLLIERRRDAKSVSDPVFALELAVLAMSGSMLPSATTATATPLRVILSEAPAKPGEAEGQFSNKIKTGKLSPSAS